MTPPPPYKGDKRAFVYLLRSLSNGKFYTGWTTDIKRRLYQHNTGKCCYTKSRGPWELVGYEIYHSIEEAKERERTLKRNPRMLFLFKKRLLSRSKVCRRKANLTIRKEVVG